LKLRVTSALVAFLFALGSVCAAESLKGTVTNGTTGKPAMGDDVVLLSLSNGMNEAGRTKTDSKGQYHFERSSGQMPNLIRVIHQGVTYHQMAPPGSTTENLTVYDAAKKVDGISATVDVQRFQTEGSALQVMELIALKNASNPPRSLMNDRPFEFSLPPEAQVVSAVAQSPGGQPIQASPVPAEKKGDYYIVFPVRPGETRFEIAYQLPYNGEAVVQPAIKWPLEHLVVMLPKSMTFEAKNPGMFQPMDSEKDANVQVTTQVKPGQNVAFRIAGTGTLAESQGGGEQPQSAQGGNMRQGPGGGLGKPIEAPDPLHNWRWYILGGFAVVLTAGGVYVSRRPTLETHVEAPPEPAKPKARSTAPSTARSSNIIEALKEELFQLELDRQQGRISPEEYIGAKAALDQTIKRAVAREGRS
jgi:hypothetical protein